MWQRKPTQHAFLLFRPIEDVPDKINVRDASVRTKDFGGPSGEDANGYKIILACKSFKKSGTDLCPKLSLQWPGSYVRIINPSSIEAILANRLIPLNKGEGAVRPI